MPEKREGNVEHSSERDSKFSWCVSSMMLQTQLKLHQGLEKGTHVPQPNGRAHVVEPPPGGPFFEGCFEEGHSPSPPCGSPCSPAQGLRSWCRKEPRAISGCFSLLVYVAAEEERSAESL